MYDDVSNVFFFFFFFFIDFGELLRLCRSASREPESN